MSEILYNYWMQLDKNALVLAKTHYYSLGEPRNFRLSEDGSYVYFTRAGGSTSNLHALWRLRLKTGTEEIIFDPLKHKTGDTLTEDEEKQRERLRETSSGITSYMLSKNDKYITFTNNGALWLVDTESLKCSEFTHVDSAFDPHFSGDSGLIGYVDSRGLWYVSTEADAKPVNIAGNDTPGIHWGRAEFIASEEFERYRGYWWAPSGRKLVVSRVDETEVLDTYSPSSEPWEPPAPFKYPAAGTKNAAVSLFMCETASSDRTEIRWDSQKWPYVLNVQWKDAGLFVTVQSRDQRDIQLLRVSDSGDSAVVHEESDESWVDVIQPLPSVTDDGHIIGLKIAEKRRLTYDDRPVTPAGHHVDDYLGISGDWLVYTASPDPKERVVFAANIEDGTVKPLSPSGGLFSGFVTSGRIFISGAEMKDSKKTRLLYQNIHDSPDSITIRSFAEPPADLPEPIFFTVGPDKIQASLLLPRGHNKKDTLPVLLQVYGGPHHQEVLMSRRSYLEAQWWTEQGYAVLSADGPGTPGRDSAWERRIRNDLITEPAAAQIEVLTHALEHFPYLDGSRVAVRGWSFGGYLSAYLSVLYPDAIHASVSGAPVTDWRLYDTHYTERYLGDPKNNDAAYRKSSLLEAASKAERPILLIHGLGDDNVIFSNSLKLLEVLGETNSPYQFIPLSGASHFTKHAEQQAWLLQMERSFLDSPYAHKSAD